MDREQFINELAKINVFLNDNQLSQLEKYYELLLEWNQKINLTRITEKKENIITKNKIPFVKFMPIAVVISTIIFIASVFIFVQKIKSDNFNLSIDFAGGVELNVKIDNPQVINIAEIRALYSHFGEETINIQELEGEENINSFLLRPTR